MPPPAPRSERPLRASGWLAWWRRWWSGEAAPEASASPGTGAGKPSPRRRHRERVALLVREVMIRHGVLSSRYRVRVLSLDRAGLQHLVLIDWLPTPGGLAAGPTPETSRLEAEVRDEAVQTLGLEVRAVYWRGSPAAGGRPRREPDDDGPGPLSAPRS